MTAIKYEYGSVNSAMATELDNLADTSQAISVVIDNSADLYLFDDVELHTEAFSYAPNAGAVVELYLIRSTLDGTSYEDGDASILPPSNNLVGAFLIRPSTSAQTHVLRQIPIPPSAYRYVVVNRTGVSFANVSNTLKNLSYRYQTE